MSWFSLSHFRASFLPQIQAHNLLHICNPLYTHRPVINPVYYQKAIKLTSCQTNNTLQQKVADVANLKGPSPRTTSDVIHQHSHPSSKYCSRMILPPGLELGCLQREGVEPIRYRVNMFCQTTTKKTLTYFYNNLVVSFRSHY